LGGGTVSVGGTGDRLSREETVEGEGMGSGASGEREKNDTERSHVGQE